MNVVDNRNAKWNKAMPVMNMMYALVKLFPVSFVKKSLEKRRFKTGWTNMAWRYVYLKRLGAECIGGGV